MPRLIRSLPLVLAILAVPILTLAWRDAWSTPALVAIQVLLSAYVVVSEYFWIRQRAATRVRGVSDRIDTAATHKRVGFVGRELELASIVKFHRKARVKGRHLERTGPLVLMISGQAGVGKTAFARELAGRIAPIYTDGVYYTNLGHTGGPRAPAEVLGVLLERMHWRDDLPPGIHERQMLFRALCAGKSSLFIFDAAREPAQIAELLPAEPRCTVIVTSRRDFAANFDSRSWHLNVPDIGDALMQLYSVAQIDEFDEPEHAVNLVELCGRLPVAIQSAAERIAYRGEKISTVTAKLADESIRPHFLSFGGRDIREPIAVEYAKLSHLEQRALCLLSVVESPTFGLFSLCPLLSISVPEAENLLTTLYRSQLIDAAGPDVSTDLTRYQFNPLVKLLVQERIAYEPELAVECARARRRLEGAFRDAAIRVLDESDSSANLSQKYPVEHGSTMWFEPWFRLVVANSTSVWIESEYRDLVLCAFAAHHDGEWALCWRLVARLGDFVPLGSVDNLHQLFKQGRRAAVEDGTRHGEAAVLIAHASFLNAIEDYGSAHMHLAEAASLLSVHEVADDRRRNLQLAAIHMKYGDGYLQMRSPSAAREAFGRARKIYQELSAEKQMWIVESREALNTGRNAAREAEPGSFWAMVASAERRRHASAWDGAAEDLARAALLSAGDARRTAGVQYRIARLHLEHAEALIADVGVAGRSDALLSTALRYATQSMLTLRTMRNEVGEVRLKCLLVRIMAAADRPSVARKYLVSAQEQLDRLERLTPADALDPLKARRSLAEGYLYVATQKPEQASRAFRDASDRFAALNDDRNSAAALRRYSAIAADASPVTP